MAKGSRSGIPNTRENGGEPRQACAQTQSGLFGQRNSAPAAMPPNFQNLMNDRLPSEISEAKMKSAELDDTEKHEQTQQQNDFQMQ